MQRRGFSLINQNCTNYEGVILDEFDIFWDVCTTQKDYAYILLRVYRDVVRATCVDEYVRATL